ncbi:MAG: hypothetical protein V3S03_08530 [Vicinamibacteria bacterium]
MESCKLLIDNAARFDEILEESRRDGLPECADLEIVTKAGATQGGASGVIVSWTVNDGGRIRRVQATTTVKVLAAIAAGLQGIVLQEELLARAPDGWPVDD